MGSGPCVCLISLIKGEILDKGVKVRRWEWWSPSGSDRMSLAGGEVNRKEDVR